MLQTVCKCGVGISLYGKQLKDGQHCCDLCWANEQIAEKDGEINRSQIIRDEISKQRDLLNNACIAKDVENSHLRAGLERIKEHIGADLIEYRAGFSENVDKGEAYRLGIERGIIICAGIAAEYLGGG